MPPISAPVLSSLKEPIMGILRQSDLSSVSAKSVRQSLINLNDPRNPNEKLLQRLQIRLDDKEQKKQIDELIRNCFDDINNPTPVSNLPSSGLALPMGNGSAGYSNGNGSSAPNSGAPKLALPGMGGIPGSNSAIPPLFPGSSSSSINAKKASGGGGSVAGGKRSRKADADTISDDEEDADAETIRKKANAASKKKSSTKKRKSAKGEDGEKPPANPNNPFNKPVILSDEMSKICGGKEMPRYMITKQLWAYIKERDLQNPANKRQIMCDPTLQSLFGKPTVDSFEMAKLISNHVTKKVE